MVLWKYDDSITLTHVDVAQSDILIVQCKIQSMTFTLSLVYMSVNDYNLKKQLFTCTYRATLLIVPTILYWETSMDIQDSLDHIQ